MENKKDCGVIIKRLREMRGLTVRKAASELKRATGWLSEIENGKGTARITQKEFDRIVTTLNGDQHRHLFMTWMAAYKKREKTDRTFDGAVLKFIRRKKGLSLVQAARLVSLRASQLCQLERGLLPMTWQLRDQIMQGYGYTPSSFRNFTKDPARARAVPIKYKLEIILNQISEEQMAEIFNFTLSKMIREEHI